MTMLEIAKALREMNLKDPNAWADELIQRADNGPRFEKIVELSAEFLGGILSAKEYVDRVIEQLMDTSFDPEGVEPIIAFASALVKAEPQEDEDAALQDLNKLVEHLKDDEEEEDDSIDEVEEEEEEAA
jgi:hypothetical protein